MDNCMFVPSDLNRLLEIRNAAQNIRMISGVAGIVMLPLNTIANFLQFSINLFEPDSTNQNLSGAISYERRIIYVNGTESIRRQRFIIAHEFGHILLHREYQNEPGWVYDLLTHDDKLESREKEADLFAAELLMPVDLLNKEMDYRNGQLTYVADDFQVSMDAMRDRLDFLRNESRLRSKGFSVEWNGPKQAASAV